ncbi:glycogen debranching protein, partial [Thermodesulfobacteriota bacterium]
MANTDLIIQDPAPGTRLLVFRGDTLTFTISLASPIRGNAWVRTNIGHAETTRREIIRQIRHHEPLLGKDWFDIPMKRKGDRLFQITLPLAEVGHFEAKCFYRKTGESDPLWPPGPNIIINVEPAHTCCANIIYNAFVRQFGPNKERIISPDLLTENRLRSLDNAGYTVIPPSGTFRKLIAELDFIIGKLGCRIIQLLPINPTPTTYARMGRFGSPYAALSFTMVDPALAEFDPKATPLEQFIELVDAVHTRNAKIIIDLAVNHTGWAATLHETHPEWLTRDPEGRIEVPGAWGVRWEDLTKLDYTHQELWQFIADVFLNWCKRGVDGFRCDAGYMIPVPAWQYIVATVREQYADTIFLLEGLGGKISTTRDILNRANFNWAYSELFQNYDRNQIESYLPGAIEISKGEGITVHFAETHDNPRLASRSTIYANLRTALCALCSHQGGFGFANGVEWYATEKIDVHGNPSLNWGGRPNQVQHIRRLTSLLKNHPAFHDSTNLRLVQEGPGNHIALLRHHIPSGKKLLIVANLDDAHQSYCTWAQSSDAFPGNNVFDLLSRSELEIRNAEGLAGCLLEPGQVICLTDDPRDLALVRDNETLDFLKPERVKNQGQRAKALDVFRFYNGTKDVGDWDPNEAARQLVENPIEYCRKLNPFSEESRVVTWQWPRDVKREVMLAPDHFLLVRAETHFHARIYRGQRCIAQEESLLAGNGTFFALFIPVPPPKASLSFTLSLSVFTPDVCQHIVAQLLYLPLAENLKVKKVYSRSDLLDMPRMFLGTNGRGGMLRVPVRWGELRSKYDALLAGNLHPGFPEDRRVMFTRCRAWLVFQGYSQ